MNERYYLWGAGGVGKRALKYILPLGILEGIIDSNPDKWGQVINGLKVYDYEKVKPKLKNCGVIIAYFGSKETEELLKGDGINYWKLSDFITMWYREKRHQNAIGFLDFPITTRCTLNCRDCMQYLPYRQKEDVPIEILKRDLKVLFEQVSFVGEISIIGGEPFLYKYLGLLLEHIGENCSKNTGSLVITTNGMVVPDTRILEWCRRLEVFVSVSDYSDTLPQTEDKVILLENAAKKAGVKIERKCWNWVDPGKFSDFVNYADCGQAHMQLSGGKLWRCTLVAAAFDAGFCRETNGFDCYDLLLESNDIKRFLNHNTPQRTLQCERCLYKKGIAIPAAVQT